VTSLQLKIAELEEEKRSNIIKTAEEIIVIKAEKDKMERDYLERLSELERKFAESMTDYDCRLTESEECLNALDKQLKEHENKVQELASSLEKAKKQLVKMKRECQANLEALKKQQKTSTVVRFYSTKFKF